jgi:hypothetical protein
MKATLRLPLTAITAAAMLMICVPLAATDPESAPSASQKGRSSFDQGDFSAAIDHYTDAIRLTPKSAIRQTPFRS